ncbi:MAG: cytochrome c biogenesis protein ResB [Vulcanimicrobiota bacterium]
MVPVARRGGLLWRSYQFMASIKLAVILLLGLAAILATATFYESLYDSKTAQHLVYGSTWFAAFLGLLFINIFCSTTIRYPWKRHQVGFVVTHLGILFILMGSLQTQLYGVDGQMPVREGSSEDRVILDKPVLLLGPSARNLKEKPVEFRWNPPSPEHPFRIELGNGVTALVDTYLHHATPKMLYLPIENGEPAVHLRFKSSRFDMDQWISSSQGPQQMGLAQVSLAAASQQDIENLAKAGKQPPVPGSIGMLVQGRPLQLPAADFQAVSRPLPESPYRARILRYDAKTQSIDLEVSGPDGSQVHHLSALDSKLNRRQPARGQEPEVRALYVGGEAAEAPSGKSLQLFVTPQSQVYCRLNGAPPQLLARDVPLKTGWMDIQISLQEVLASAASQETYQPFKVRKGRGGGNAPPAAIRLTLEGARQKGPFWLQAGGSMLESSSSQGQPLVLGYSFATVPLGVRVELVKFVIGYDPGTRNPASFQSTVKVNGEEHKVEMNEPFHLGNYTFYQASYEENSQGPQVSVFSVTCDPGIKSKYLGSILLVGGIFTMFYLKPGRRRKQEKAVA